MTPEFEADDRLLAFEVFEGEEESPYLRRQRAVKVRRRGQAWGWRRWFLLTGIVLAVGPPAWFLAVFLESSPRFELRSADDFELSGNQFVTREEIADQLGLPVRAGSAHGGKLFRMSLESTRQQLELIPWVRSATVVRLFPNRLQIRIEERKPVAFANVDGIVRLVDEDGVLMVKRGSATFDFPVITGLDANASPEDRRSRMALFRKFMLQLRDEIAQSGWTVSEADLANDDDFKVLLVQGPETVLIHFGHDNFRAHFRDFQALLPGWRRANALPESVDLRYPYQVVVNPRGTVPPAPAPGSQTLETIKD
jgi:cell division protein FtsQ